MSEHPKLGEWYQHQAYGRLLCVSNDGDFVDRDIEHLTPAMHTLRHLPDCTGWDWVEPTPERVRVSAEVRTRGYSVGGWKVLNTTSAGPDGRQVELIERRPGDPDPDEAIEVREEMGETAWEQLNLERLNDWWERLGGTK